MKFFGLVLAALVATAATTVSAEPSHAVVHRMLPPGEDGYEAADGSRNASETVGGGRRPGNSSEYAGGRPGGHGNSSEYAGRHGNRNSSNVTEPTSAPPASGASTAMMVGTAAAMITAVAAVI